MTSPFKISDPSGLFDDIETDDPFSMLGAPYRGRLARAIATEIVELGAGVPGATTLTERVGVMTMHLIERTKQWRAALIAYHPNADDDRLVRALVADVKRHLDAWPDRPADRAAHVHPWRHDA